MGALCTGAHLYKCGIMGDCSFQLVEHSVAARATFPLAEARRHHVGRLDERRADEVSDLRNF